MTVPVRLLMALVLLWGVVGTVAWYLRRCLRTGVVLGEPGLWSRYYVRRRTNAAGYWFEMTLWTFVLLVLTGCAVYFTTLLFTALDGR